MECPKCKNSGLRKKGSDASAHCNKCGGMWLGGEELPNFIEKYSEQHDDEVGSSVNDKRTGLCPSGHGILIRAKIEIDEPFYLEKCSACGGIWFDNGEWQRIVNHDLAHNLNELWCRSWQAKQRQEKSRNSYLEANKELLGDAVFDEIMRLSEKLKDHPEKGRAIALLQQEVLKN